MRYRRAFVPGGTFFFTVNLADRSQTLLTDHVDALRSAVRHVRSLHPFGIVAMVVLPDHLHALWQLPESDSDYPLRWTLIKAGFSRAIGQQDTVTLSRRFKRERGIWQRRYWEHQIRDDRDLAQHIDYIHGNPVKHGYASRPIDWPYSSIHRYVREGVLTEDWAGG